MFRLFQISLLIFAIILSFPKIVLCQASSEFIQEGFSNYQNGDYEDAVQSFNKALKSNTSSSTDAVSTQSRKVYGSESKTTQVDANQKQYMGTTEKSYVDESQRELIDTETKKYYAEPLQFQGDEPAKIYLYKGRTYLQLGNKEAALNDFDKAVSLDPTLSEALFRRALANTKVDPNKACPDLLVAIERGHKSAKELYDLICKK
jgi:tetratricopeptide (TPR) repeat protein